MPTSLIQMLRNGKAKLRGTSREASLEEKLRALVRAQRMYLEIVASRRQLKPWERPWNILSDIRDSVVIKDDVIEARKNLATMGSSRSYWVRPDRPWILPL